MTSPSSPQVESYIDLHARQVGLVPATSGQRRLGKPIVAMTDVVIECSTDDVAQVTDVAVVIEPPVLLTLIADRVALDLADEVLELI